MATSIMELRKQKGKTLQNVIKSLESGSKQEDSRFWKPTRDKSGSGNAVIRFLPALNGDELPWVKVFSFGFQDKTTGKWYIEESPSTIGKPDPVNEMNIAAYASKDESRIEEAKLRKRRTQYISNVYIVKDPGNPENEGKVMLFKYGSKIHEMILAKANPEFDDDQPVEVWDIDNGCNFKLRIRQVKNYPNYDSSEWAQESPLAPTDDEMSYILSKAYKLSEFHDPSKFKTYEQLKARLDTVMNSQAVRSAAERANDDANDPPFDIETEIAKASEKTRQPRKIEQSEKSKSTTEDDDDLAEFEKMLQDL